MAAIRAWAKGKSGLDSTSIPRVQGEETPFRCEKLPVEGPDPKGGAGVERVPFFA
jgi:hypothetical protein